MVGSPAARILVFSVGFAIQAPPPFPGGGEHGGARFLPACWLAGRLVPAPSSAGSALAGCCCRLAVVVVVSSCLLVVLAGSRGMMEDGPGNATCACEAGDEGVAVGRLAVGVFCVPSSTRACVCVPAGFLPGRPPPWRGFALGPPATIGPRGDASGTLLCDAEGGENLTAKTTRSETGGGDGLNPTWSHTRTVPKL